MKKIQKCQMGATLDLDLAPYSFSAPAAISAAAAAGKAALPYITTAGQVALPLTTAAGTMGLGLYVLANGKNGAVSGAIDAAAEIERLRHLAEAEAKWKEKNQNYADLINTYGSIQYPVGTFYNYDPSTGTAYLEKVLGNGLIGRWTQNMRTNEKGNPYVYDIVTGKIYNGVMTGSNSASVQVPITLSTGHTASLPTYIPNYRVFDEAAGDQTGSGTVPKQGDGEGGKEQSSEKKDENNKSENTDPKNQKDNWWKQRGKSFTDSFGRSVKAMGSGFTKGSDATLKTIGFVLPPLTVAGLGYGAYKAGEHFGLWGDENKPKPTSQQPSEGEIPPYQDTINYFKNLQWTEPQH